MILILNLLYKINEKLYFDYMYKILQNNAKILEKNSDKCTIYQQETCEVEKRGCKGCYYNGRI